MTNTTQTQIDAMLLSINEAIDSRLVYESEKNADNHSIKKTFAKIRADMCHTSIAAVLIDSNYSADSINSSLRVSNRRNAYAIKKDANTARYLASVARLNHFTEATLRTILAIENASLVFTHKDATAACSASVKHSDAKRERIIKSTRLAKHEHLSTATTQASSSLSALKALNVICDVQSDSSDRAYKLNRENFATIALFKKLALSLDAVASVEA